MAKRRKKTIEDSLSKKATIRFFLMLGGLVGSFGSLIFTCRSLLAMAPIADFTGPFWSWNGDTYLYLGFAAAGITVSATQISSMILFFIKDKKNYGMVAIYALATFISMFITINTLSLGMNKETYSAKKGDDRYQALIKEESRLINTINKLEEQRVAEHNARHWTASKSFETEMMAYNGMLRQVRRKIETFDDGGIVTIKSNFQTMSNDFKKLMGKQLNENPSNDVFSLVLTYVLFLAISLIIDLGPNIMLSYGIVGIIEIEREVEEQSNSKKELPKHLQKPVTKMNLDEVKEALPYAERIHSMFNVIWENALSDSDNENASMLVCGGGGAGKTVLLADAIEKGDQEFGVLNEIDFVVFDPKKKKNGKWPTVPIGYGEQYGKILAGLRKLKDICEFRSRNVGDHRPIIVVIDEMYKIGKYCKAKKIDWGELWTWLLTFGRENRMYLIGLSQSDTAESMGTKGEHDVLNSFGIIIKVKRHIGRKLRWAETKMIHFDPELYGIPEIKRKTVFNTKSTPEVMGDDYSNVSDFIDTEEERKATALSLGKIFDSLVKRKARKLKSGITDAIANRMVEIEKEKQVVAKIEPVSVPVIQPPMLQSKPNPLPIVGAEQNLPPQPVLPAQTDKTVSNVITFEEKAKVKKKLKVDVDTIEKIVAFYWGIENKDVEDNLIVTQIAHKAFKDVNDENKKIVLDVLNKNNLLNRSQVRRKRKRRVK